MANNDTSFLSPGVYSFEADISQLPARAAAIGGAFIGTTLKGPAFKPVQVNSFSDFRTIFGGFDRKMYTPYAVRSYIANSPIATVVRVLGKGNPSNGYTVDLGRAFLLAFGTSDLNNTTASSYTASLSAVETIAVLRSRQSGGTDIVSDVSYTGTVQSFTANINGTLYKNLSLDRTQKNYIKNILGTDPMAVHGGDSATGVYVDRVLDYRVSTYIGAYTGSAYGSSNNAASASVTGLRYITGGYKTAETPFIVSQPYVSGTSVTTYNLFKLVSLTDGESSNKDVKISFRDIETTTLQPKIAPRFTVLVRAYDDIDKRPIVLESYRVSLDTEATDFIGKKIGDSYYTVQINTPGSTPEYVFNGKYINKSAFVRVSVEEGYNFDARPAGFRGPKGINPFVGTLANGNPAYENDMPLRTTHVDDNTGVKTSKVFLGFNFEGTSAIGYEDRLAGTFTAVDSTLGSRGFMILATTAESTTWTPSLTATYNLSLTSDFTTVDVTVTGSNTIVQNAYQFSVPLLGGHDGISPSVSYDKAINDGSLSAEYISALATLANPDELDINLLCIPGVHSGASTYNGQIVARAIEMCEDRGDCFYIADIGQPLTPSSTNITTQAALCSVSEAVDTANGYDSNRAAVYYPWIQIFDDSIQELVSVPPSVEVCAVYAFTDRVAQPWFAPAGLNRASLSKVLRVYKRIVKEDRDTLQTNNVNPIAFFTGQGPVVWGQKTLQQQESALQSVNIVRLLIYIEKLIAGIGRTQLFEQNDERSRQILRDTINPILARIQAQRGLTAFKLTIDESNNTNDDIDRNQMNGKLMLQPTRTLEKLVFTYVITRTGASFEPVNG